MSAGRKAAGPLCVAGVLLLGSALFVVPAWRAESRVRSEVGEFERELRQAANPPEVIQKLEARLGRVRDAGDERMKPIPEQSDVSGLMRRLSEMLDELGLDRRDLTTGRPREHDEAMSLPMSVMVEGPYPRVIEAVSRIEGLERLVRVQRLRLRSARAETPGEVRRDGTVRADILLEVFYAPRTVGADASGEEGA